MDKEEIEKLTDQEIASANRKCKWNSESKRKKDDGILRKWIQKIE